MGRTIPPANDLVARIRNASSDELVVFERILAADERKTVQKALVAARKRIQAQEAEQQRIAALYAFDQSCGTVVLGLDEVGRGPLAGPLAVGGVVLPTEPQLEGLNDSKQVAESKRDGIADRIKACALAWTVEYIEPHEIDACGMSASLRTAFGRAIRSIEAQGIVPDVVLLDGNPLHIDPREMNVIKGDTQSAAIAAASLVAKTSRDALMRDYASAYPAYGFDSNKGYASADHCAAIRKHGLSPLHRVSFCSAFLLQSLF